MHLSKIQRRTTTNVGRSFDKLKTQYDVGLINLMSLLYVFQQITYGHRVSMNEQSFDALIHSITLVRAFQIVFAQLRMKHITMHNLIWLLLASSIHINLSQTDFRNFRYILRIFKSAQC